MPKPPRPDLASSTDPSVFKDQTADRLVSGDRDGQLASGQNSEVRSVAAPPAGIRLERRAIPQPLAVKSHSKFPAWLISVFFHVIVITSLATLWTSQYHGTGAEGDRPMGLAVVYQTSSGEEYFLSDGGGAEDSQASAASAAISALPSDGAAAAQQAELLAGLLPTGNGAADGLVEAAGSLGLGDGGSELGGSRSIPKVKTSVFGVEGEGTRFVYVFDRSDSMNGYEGKPMLRAKEELLKSLESLSEAHQFQIVFYNDTPLPFGGFGGQGAKLVRGERNMLAKAQQFVRGMEAVGGTRHIDALRMAIGMNPDVIFFLTDADFPAPSNRDIENLQTRADRAGASIHAIQFGSGPNQTGGGWIRSLAEGALGKYRYIDVSQF